MGVYGHLQQMPFHPSTYFDNSIVFSILSSSNRRRAIRQTVFQLHTLQGYSRFWNPNPLGLGGKTALVCFAKALFEK